jgi:hypothetical protein
MDWTSATGSTAASWSTPAGCTQGNDRISGGNSTATSPAASGSVATRLLEIYRECLENNSWVTILLETSRERISFSCRPPPTSGPSRKQEKNRPANEKRRARNKRRREEWVERRRTAAASAASYAAVAAGTHAPLHSTADPAVVASAAAAPVKASHPDMPLAKQPTTMVTVRASECPSVVAKRKNLPQLDGCLSPADSTFESQHSLNLNISHLESPTTPLPPAMLCSTTPATTEPTPKTSSPTNPMSAAPTPTAPVPSATTPTVPTVSATRPTLREVQREIEEDVMEPETPWIRWKRENLPRKCI